MKTTETNQTKTTLSNIENNTMLSDRIGELERKFTNKVEETKHLAAEKYNRAEQYLKNSDFRQAIDDVKKFAVKKPLTAIGIGVGLGYVVGKLMRLGK